MYVRLPLVECSSDTDENVYEQLSVRSRTTERKSGFSRGRRRPDKAIYVPRALRQSESEPSLSSSSCSLSLSVSEESSSDNTDPPPASHEPGTDGTEESASGYEAAVHTAGAELVDCDQTLSYFMAMTLEDDKSSDDTSQTHTACLNTEETVDYHHEVQRLIHTGALRTIKSLLFSSPAVSGNYIILFTEVTCSRLTSA